MTSDYISIEKRLLKSEAWRGLTGIQKNVYSDFLLKRRLSPNPNTKKGRKKEWIITNNGQLEYCYSEAKKKGISPDSFRNAIDALTSRGLIDIEHLGSGGWKGDKTKYAISNRWRKWGTPEFSPGEVRPKDRRQGRGWAAYHMRRKHKTSI